LLKLDIQLISDKYAISAFQLYKACNQITKDSFSLPNLFIKIVSVDDLPTNNINLSD